MQVHNFARPIVDIGPDGKVVVPRDALAVPHKVPVPRRYDAGDARYGRIAVMIISVLQEQTAREISGWGVVRADDDGVRRHRRLVVGAGRSAVDLGRSALQVSPRGPVDQATGPVAVLVGDPAHDIGPEHRTQLHGLAVGCAVLDLGVAAAGVVE